MPKLITILWRDIPSQVVVRKGRETLKLKLSSRFQMAIDRAAMRAGKGGSAMYIDEWRRVSRACSDDLQADMAAEVEKLEQGYSDTDLELLVKSKGLAGDVEVH